MKLLHDIHQAAIIRRQAAFKRYLDIGIRQTADDSPLRCSTQAAYQRAVGAAFIAYLERTGVPVSDYDRATLRNGDPAPLAAYPLTATDEILRLSVQAAYFDLITVDSRFASIVYKGDPASALANSASFRALAYHPNDPAFGFVDCRIPARPLGCWAQLCRGIGSMAVAASCCLPSKGSDFHITADNQLLCRAFD